MKKYLIVISSVTLCIYLTGCGRKKESGNGLQTIASPEYAIAYNVLTDGENDNYEVFTMNMDGTEKRNVTKLDGVEWTYYSHKDKLYFISDKDTCQRCNYFLYETNWKGDHPRKVSNIPLADSWMSSTREASEFIVRPGAKLDSAFYIIDQKGILKQRIETGLPNFSDPLFVDSGAAIVFRGGSKKSKREPGYQEELYIIQRNGSGLKQLTHYPPADTSAPWWAYRAGPPKLHPIDSFISYQSYRNDKYSLFAVALDGSKQWKLTERPEEEGWHDWSPDGKWLAIEVFDHDQTQFHIGLMNWETQEMTVLTDTTYKYQQAPNFVLKGRG